MKLVRHNIVFLKGNAASSTREEKKPQKNPKTEVETEERLLRPLCSFGSLQLQSGMRT